MTWTPLKGPWTPPPELTGMTIPEICEELLRLRAALKPFAREWEDNWEGFHNYTDDDDLSLDEMKGSDLTAGHLRAAAEALKGKPAP